MSSTHEVHIDDQDGLSDISGDVLGAVVMGALNSTKRAVVEAYPRVGRADDRLAESDEAVDIEDEANST